MSILITEIEFIFESIEDGKGLNEFFKESKSLNNVDKCNLLTQLAEILVFYHKEGLSYGELHL